MTLEPKQFCSAFPRLSFMLGIVDGNLANNGRMHHYRWELSTWRVLCRWDPYCKSSKSGNWHSNPPSCSSNFLPLCWSLLMAGIYNSCRLKLHSWFGIANWSPWVNGSLHRIKKLDFSERYQRLGRFGPEKVLLVTTLSRGLAHESGCTVPKRTSIRDLADQGLSKSQLQSN